MPGGSSGVHRDAPQVRHAGRREIHTIIGFQGNLVGSKSKSVREINSTIRGGVRVRSKRDLFCSDVDVVRQIPIATRRIHCGVERNCVQLHRVKVRSARPRLDDLQVLHSMISKIEVTTSIPVETRRVTCRAVTCCPINRVGFRDSNKLKLKEVSGCVVYIGLADICGQWLTRIVRESDSQAPVVAISII